ncbi:MAG: O-antigen ligase family protein [Candidatus Curtissbacteria bacterium]|nr:O-antigen ligase family protein [Candidatus Curtissbacteria bacterium]
MELIKLLTVLTIFSIIPGQLIRIPISQSAIVTISDIASAFLLVVFLLYSTSIKKKLFLPKSLFIPFLIFTLTAVTSTILASVNFSQREIFVALLFLVRYILYFSIFIIVANTVKKTEVINWLNLFLTTSVIFSILGFLQFIFFSDLTVLAIYGWDPHQKRIVSTLLDPNFTGGLLTIAFAISISLFLYLKKRIYLVVTAVLFSALILTFSRSSYLALVCTVFVIGLLKSPKVLVIFLFIILLSFISIPQARNRVLGALALDETSQARIQSWSKALMIFKDNPILGVGFNTYRATQAQYGFFASEQPEGGHSGAGTDSSILLVLATTGVVGIAAYLAFLFAIAKTVTKNVRSSPLSLGATAAFVGLLVHSQFVNSLFFPQIMIIFFFLLGLCVVYDN